MTDGKGDSMGYASDQQSGLGHPADALSGKASDETPFQGSDISELLSQIMHLQPHEEVDIVMTSEGVQNTLERPGDTEHRGYLMDIELGEISTICVKRTF